MPVRSILKVSHRISQGIVETAEEENCNFLILAREKQPAFFDRLFSSVIDTVLQETHCEVAVLHGVLPAGAIRNIVIPFGQNIHTRLSVETASALVDYFGCAARILAVFEPDVAQAQREERVRKIHELARANTLNARVETVHDKGVLQGVRSARRART